MITDVELNRAVNALSATLRDQRPDDFDAERFQGIVDGALAGERKLLVRHAGGDRGELLGEDGDRLASIRREGGTWVVTREVTAVGSRWAIPQPEGR